LCFEGRVINGLLGGGRRHRSRHVPVAYGDRLRPWFTSLRHRPIGSVRQKLVLRRNDAQGSIHRLYGRAVEILAHLRIDAKHLPAVVLDDLVDTGTLGSYRT
jgi:hypothetical protein